MTQGKEWRHILMFALPLMAGHALQQLYNTVDGIIVGNYVSDIALGAVGTCAPLTMLFIALAIGMSNGSSIVIAQCYGAKHYEEMRRAVATAMILLISMGVVLSIVGVLVARPMLVYVLNVGEAYLEYSIAYFGIYAAGLLFQFTYNICAAIMRALGDSKATLYFLVVSSIANIVLDLLFVLVFHWGVSGAAIATIISQALSAVVALVYMFKRHEVLRFQKGEFRFYSKTAKLCMRLAIPNTLAQCVVSCGNLAVQRLINSFDVLNPGLMAGATAGTRLESFIFIPIFSFNSSVATFTGQNVGAGKMDRVAKGRKAAMLMSAAICIVISGIGLIFREPLISIFGVSGDSLYYGTVFLKIFCPGLILFSLHMSTAGVMQGAGDVMFNTVVTLTSFAARVILAYTLAYFSPLGYLAIWISTPISWVYNIIMSWSRFYSGAWKKKAVVRRNAAVAASEE